MTVTVICEECGKIYHIAADKLKRFEGREIRGRCQCSHVTTFRRPEELESGYDPPPPADLQPVDAAEAAAAQPEEDSQLSELEEIYPVSESAPADTPDESLSAPGAAPVSEAQNREAPSAAGSPTSRAGLGIRVKMMLLFLAIPLVLIAALGFVLQRQMQSMAGLITSESVHTVTQMAQEIIADAGRSVAKQAKLYLVGHPQLAREQFRGDIQFRRIAVQKVGLTGYTFLYAVAEGGQAASIWLHPDEGLNGRPISEAFQKILGKNYGPFAQITKPIDAGRNVEAAGYFPFPERDGTLREKYLVTSPIEGTPYGIASTTYIDEFTVPAKRLDRQVQKMTTQARNISIGVVAGTLLIIGLLVSIYAHRLTKSLNNLTDIADRISVGELDAEIKIQSRDEIGMLAEAISRMQDSLRLSIQRLRRRH